MYQTHFGLGENPFGPNPSPEFIYRSQEHQEALAHFRYALANREAFVLLTGEVGTGKTTAVHALRRELPEGTPVAVVTHTTLSPAEFLEEIAIRFGLFVEMGESRPSLVRRLEKFLEDQLRGVGQALIIIDEAHLLSVPVLEEVRLLSNLEQNGWKLVQICLVGQPELETHLQSPELRQLRQRISVRYTLNPLTAEQTREYIHHRLRVAGNPDPAKLFADDAVQAVHTLTHGIPREINVVAGQAMLNAFIEEVDQVSRAHVYSVKQDYGFEGIVTGRSGSRPAGAPTPPVPRQVPTRTAPISPAAGSPPPRTDTGPAAPSGIGTGGGPASSPPPVPDSKGIEAPVSSMARRPIPLPPASLRPPPVRRPAPTPSPRPVPTAAPVESSSVRAEPGRPAAGSGLDYQGRWGGVNRWALGLVILMALVLLIAGGMWWRDVETPTTADGDPATPANTEGGAPSGTEPVSSTPETNVAGSPAGDVEEWVAIQVASFRTRSRAESVLATVERSTGLKGVVLQAEVEGVIWHRILLGAFSSAAEAESAGAPLIRERTIRQIVVRPIPLQWVSSLLGEDRE